MSCTVAVKRLHGGRAWPTAREAHRAVVTVCYRCFLETESQVRSLFSVVFSRSPRFTHVKLIVGLVTHGGVEGGREYHTVSANEECKVVGLRGFGKYAVECVEIQDFKKREVGIYIKT